ncbi:MAG: response regulator [Candidatus Bipolaricaulota bacterium]|nr:response regulator [Candidatus Bipolaricaulota bacterium]MDW8031021.1 response regulator [Candidatus Bipolaricaulota bacterium]
MKRILLAEDDLQIARLVKFKLEREGFAVECVEDGETALQRVRQEPFDLVLLDVMIPGRDGFTVLSELRADPKYCDLPIVMLTARATERDLRAGASATDYIVKPFDPAYLVEPVRAILGE